MFQTISLSETIDGYVKSVEENINSYHCQTYSDVDLYHDISSNYSIEGSKLRNVSVITLNKYFDKENIVKITASFDGENADLLSEYYVMDNKLMYVCQKLTIYKLPKWHDDFDSLASDVRQNRFYIKDESIARWVDDFDRNDRNDRMVEMERNVSHDFMAYIGYE